MRVGRLGILAMLVSGAVAGCGDPEPALPGADRSDRLVDVGDHRLHLVCVGTGTPTVVVEMGFNTVAADWEERQLELASSTRTCVYERAGVGTSEPGPLPRTAQRIADELADLIHAAGIEAPVVLVGESAGGDYLRAFGQRHPDDVAGLVFVDVRLLEYDAASADVLTPDEQAVIDRRVANLPEPYGDEVRAGPESGRAIQAGPDLPDVPVIVLTAGLHPPDQSQADIDLWNESHERLAASVRQGRQRVIADAYHLMPAAPVAAAVDEVLELLATDR